MRLIAATLWGLMAMSVALPAADTPATPGHRFRVASTHGVPQLVEDGIAIRPRIFFGQPEGVAQMRIGQAWTTCDFTFTAEEDDPAAALHLRFGEESGAVWFDDITLTDATTGQVLMSYDFESGRAPFDRDWRFWCRGLSQDPPLTVAIDPGQGMAGGAALTVSLKADPKLEGFHLFRGGLHLQKDHRYRTVIAVRSATGRSFRPSYHHQGGDYHCQGGMPSPYAEQVALAAGAGVDLVSFITPAIWVEPGKQPDYHRLDRACRMTLAANPRALLLVRVSLNAPAWWVRSHPDDAMRYEGGVAGDDASVASPVYRADAIAALRRTIRYCEDHFGAHMVGYHPAGQNSDEWFYQHTWNHPLNGYEPATAVAWRAWLSARYRTDQALREAWHQPQVACVSATVPTPAERHAAPSGNLRDPAREQHLLDFAAFQQEGMADMVCALAQAVRAEAGPGRLSVFFYGYLFEFSVIGNGPATAGHYALRRLLDSPDIDILCSPISYNDRQSGGAAPCMSAGESVLLAGKLWLAEDDTFTWLAVGGPHPPGWEAGADTYEGTLHQLRRNVAQESCRNFATWWMDLCGVGWFTDRRLWAEMDRFQAMDRHFTTTPTPFHPAVAAVVDERSLQAVAAAGSAGATSAQLLSRERAHLHRMGAPFGQYLLDDAVAGRVPAQLQVYLAAWSLDAVQRRKLKEATRNGTAVWCWAPGYIDRDTGRFSLEAVTDLTGFAVAAMPAGTTPHVRSTAAGLAAGMAAAFGAQQPVTPLLSPTTIDGDVVLATYGDGRPAVVVRKHATGIAVFAGVTELPPALLRHLARLSGVHLYAASDAIIYANGPYVAVHACADGPLDLDLGTAGPVTDESTGMVLGDGPRLTLPIAQGETRVLRIMR